MKMTKTTTPMQIQPQMPNAPRTSRSLLTPLSAVERWLAGSGQMVLRSARSASLPLSSRLRLNSALTAPRQSGWASA